MSDKQARLVWREHNYAHGGTSEIWDVGCGSSICVVYRVLATGEPETVAFPFDRVEHITGTGVLGCWPGDATGGKAMRELGYETVEDER